MKTVSSIFTALLCCVSAHLFAQGNFILEYSAPGFARCANHISCYDGGFLILNNYEQISTGNEWIALIKTDSAGSIQWTKTLGPMFTFVEDVIQTTDSGYVVCYVEFSYPGYRIVKFDQQGNIIYSNLVNGIAPYQVIAQPQLKARNGGGYYVAGDLHNSVLNKSRWQLMEFDVNGNLLWTRCYHETFSNGDPHHDFDTCSNGDLVILGTHRDSITAGPYVARIAPGGNVVWAYWWEAAFNFKTVASAIVAHPNGQLCIVTADINAVTARYETCVIQTDANGSELWSMRFSSSINLLTTEAKSVENCNTLFYFGRQKKGGPGYMFKVDTAGYILAQRKYPNHLFGLTQTTSGYMFSAINGANGRAMQFTTDYYGVGCNDSDLTINKAGITAIKYTGIEDTLIPMSVSSMVPPLVNANIYLFTVCATDVGMNELEPTKVNIFPSPADDELQIASESSIQHYEIHDANGKIIISTDCISRFETVDIRGLASGLYFVRVFNQEQITIMKFVITR